MLASLEFFCRKKVESAAPLKPVEPEIMFIGSSSWSFRRWWISKIAMCRLSPSCFKRLICALFQSLVQRDEAVLFPVQALDTVSPPPTEQEQCVGKRIQFKQLLDEARQAVYAFAQICVAAGIYRLYLRR